MRDLVKTIDHIKKEKKTKKKRETRARVKVFTRIERWVSEDEDSSSSDESFTIHSSKRNSSSISSSRKPSSHKCIMTKDVKNKVNDDESDEDSPSYDELLHLINEQQGTLKKQSKELKNSIH